MSVTYAILKLSQNALASINPISTVVRVYILKL